MALDLVEELLALADALQRRPVEFALCGGIAVAIHGAPRFTKDIDLLVPEQELAAALEEARRCGFDLPAEPMTFDAGTERERHVRRVSKADGESLLSLDLILATGPLLPALATRTWVERDGRRLPVVSREGLVLMKRLAGRPQDRFDLQALGEPDVER